MPRQPNHNLPTDIGATVANIPRAAGGVLRSVEIERADAVQVYAVECFEQRAFHRPCAGSHVSRVALIVDVRHDLKHNGQLGQVASLGNGLSHMDVQSCRRKRLCLRDILLRENAMQLALVIGVCGEGSVKQDIQLLCGSGKRLSERILRVVV